MRRINGRESPSGLSLRAFTSFLDLEVQRRALLSWPTLC